MTACVAVLIKHKKIGLRSGMCLRSTQKSSSANARNRLGGTYFSAKRDRQTALPVAIEKHLIQGLVLCAVAQI